MPQNNKHLSRTRLEIAQLAAKYVAEDGINDYLAAKKKAALQLGLHPDKNMPTNLEVERALIDYQTLFQSTQQPERLYGLRNKALNAMHLLKQFQPRLVGPVLTGTATEHSDIVLHLVSDQPELIGFHLDANAIPYRPCEKTIRTGKAEKKDYPAYQFIADNTRIVLVIFPEKEKHNLPLSAISGKPMQRASISQLEKLISN